MAEIFESILQRTLGKVPADRDKREGAIIYDTHAPVAAEFQIAYLEMEHNMDECFADTASLPYLIRRAAERGITPYPATYAILKAVSTPVDADVPVGSRFSLNELNYIVTEKITDGEYRVQCETYGEIGNSYFGTLIPIDYVQGVETITITDVLIPGEDMEDVEAFRARYFDNLSSQAFGGNIADYKEKVTALEGVGAIKVYPVWNGGGTVKVVFTDSTFGVPSDELVAKIQEAVDPVGHSGKGYGTAPIGHVVTVEGVTALTVDIVMDITYVDGWSWDACASLIQTAVDNYFNELSKDWSNNNNLVVRISQIESRILDCEGVLDVSGTTLNGSAVNISLGADEIPVRGMINGN